MKQTIMLVVYVARCILSSYKRPVCNPVSDVAYFDDLTIVSFDTCVVLLEEGLCGIWQNVVGCTTIAVIAFHGV